MYRRIILTAFVACQGRAALDRAATPPDLSGKNSAV